MAVEAKSLFSVSVINGFTKTTTQIIILTCSALRTRWSDSNGRNKRCLSVVGEKGRINCVKDTKDEVGSTCRLGLQEGAGTCASIHEPWLRQSQGEESYLRSVLFWFSLEMKSQAEHHPLNKWWERMWMLFLWRWEDFMPWSPLPRCIEQPNLAAQCTEKCVTKGTDPQECFTSKIFKI